MSILQMSLNCCAGTIRLNGLLVKHTFHYAITTANIDTLMFLPTAAVWQHHGFFLNPLSPQKPPFSPPRLAAAQHPKQSCWKASPNPLLLFINKHLRSMMLQQLVLSPGMVATPFVGCHNKSLGAPQGPPCMTPQGGALGPPPGPVQCL